MLPGFKATAAERLVVAYGRTALRAVRRHDTAGLAHRDEVPFCRLAMKKR